MRVRRRTSAALTALSMATVLVTGCGTTGGFGAGGTSAGEHSITVLMVNNPQMLELQELTKEHFTEKTGIEVNFVVKVEQDMRDTASTEFANQSGIYDVATLSNFEIPYYAEAGWISDMESIANDPEFDQDDILPPMTEALSANGKVYGQPFYGESSFLMYRKDLFEKHGLEMPPNPTWEQVAGYAAKINEAEPDMRGICLRGLAGWGDNLASITTVVNTMGGTWFDEDWNAQVNTGGFKKAANFYVDLVREHGEAGAATFSFPQCLNAMQQGKVAMWYDATSGAGPMEAADSPVKGKVGYVAAPHDQTENAGWLYTWAWAIQKASLHQEDAKEFVAWASSKEYEELVMADTEHDTGGPANVPAGKRASTYENPEYLEVAGTFATPTMNAIKNARADDPGVQKRPYNGIQFVGVPSFTDFGTECAKQLSSAISGSKTTDAALDRCQALAQAYGDIQKEKQ
ncbi:sorbitol/mannitol transport system substrate-binding protein [Nocardioides luteus]|uniref:Sugar ABC transporter substrate-binding protein n=1 Tax=Nocardioides luteus TaxID=1844 RepID=A0ABQ5T2N6_9ACTN|nr:sugar ABC transporter substrate-binding protein [Nocardioides luteus]MDR7309666.1 sorbitol/mannitol transport system substrate-binding protein [Nocardioides luteus]GGR70625.1 sugar ABC transporter substrate-binding protein [Nocardioides luteus]GLJ70550.1 sugar ABC transporter substrate-binding protein [Nocardioides luteus]